MKPVVTLGLAWPRSLSLERGYRESSQLSVTTSIYQMTPASENMELLWWWWCVLVLTAMGTASMVVVRCGVLPGALGRTKSL